MLDLDALARLEARLSGRAAAPAPRRPETPAATPRDALPQGVSEEAMRRCPHLAALARPELEAAE